MFKSLKTIAAASVLAGSLAVSASAQSADTIKVGILHSLSGTMAISETALKDVMLFLIDEQNKKGGILGKQIECTFIWGPKTGWAVGVLMTYVWKDGSFWVSATSSGAL